MDDAEDAHLNPHDASAHHALHEHSWRHEDGLRGAGKFVDTLALWPSVPEGRSRLGAFVPTCDSFCELLALEEQRYANFMQGLPRETGLAMTALAAIIADAPEPLRDSLKEGLLAPD